MFAKTVWFGIGVWVGMNLWQLAILVLVGLLAYESLIEKGESTGK